MNSISSKVMALVTQFSIAAGASALAADGSKTAEAALSSATSNSSMTHVTPVTPPASKSQATASTTAATTSAVTSTTASTTSPANTSTASNEYDDVKIQKNFIQSSTLISTTNCKIKCLDPHAETQESAQVIDILQKIYKAYTEKDLDYIGKHLAQDCITFYEGDKKVISGKQAALDDIKEWTEKEAKNIDAPLTEIILEHPYCNINQDHAVITFTAIKEVGGSHPSKQKSHCNDVFKKDGDTWVLLTHYRSSWKDLAKS